VSVSRMATCSWCGGSGSDGVQDAPKAGSAPARGGRSSGAGGAPRGFRRREAPNTPGENLSSITALAIGAAVGWMVYGDPGPTEDPLPRSIGLGIAATVASGLLFRLPAMRRMFDIGAVIVKWLFLLGLIAGGFYLYQRYGS